MKEKTIACLLLLAFSVGTLVVLAWSGIPRKALFITIDAGVIALLITALAAVWLRFIARMAGRMSAFFADNAGTYHTWQMNGFEKLEESTDLINKKLELAAEHIARLGQSGHHAINDALLQNDKISEALVKAQTQMQSLREEEEERHWIARGLAMFGEVLRNKLEIKAYSQQIVNSLVKYLEASQGAMFVACQNDEEGRYLEMTACFAYARKKYMEKRIYEGDGLLGQNMLEKHFEFITDVPADYVKITSGLGGSLPRNLIIAPLVFKDTYYGAIELALFRVLRPFQVEFLEKVCENIAGEISSINALRQTRQLLDESNLLARELKQHEEELRQNLEELAATQEEMTRKQTELNSYLQAINNTIAAVEFDMQGRFVTANEIFLKVMGFAPGELAGHDYKDLMAADTAVEMMWNSLREGKFFSGEFRMKSKKGEEMWLAGTFNPITRSGHAPDKIMMYAQFTTQEKERINDLGAMASALKATLPLVEFNAQFACKTANEKFLKLFGLSRMELKKKSILDLIAPYYSDVFERIKPEILGKEFSTLLLPVSKDGKIVTYESTIFINRNLEGKIARIILILVKKVEEQVPVLAAI